MNSASSGLSSFSFLRMSAKVILLYAREMVFTAVLMTLWLSLVIRV